MDKIIFTGYNEEHPTNLGEYRGRIADNTDVNEILLYSDESDLSLSEIEKRGWDIYTKADQQKLSAKLEKRRAEIKSTLIHELTHAAYTIKEKSGLGEKHIFSNTFKNTFLGEYRTFNGQNVEGIANYISSRIEGREVNSLDTYKAETKAIYMLAEKLDEKSIIKAVWNSDEQQFKKFYVEAIGKDQETGGRSYDDFQRKMGSLQHIRESKLSLSEEVRRNTEELSYIQEILEGKSIADIYNNASIIKPTKKLPIEDLSIDLPRDEKLSFPQKVAGF